MGISAEFLEEKKIIYVSPGIAAMVRRDMEMFEIFKGDMTPNPNHFLSMLIEGYYDRYVQEKRDARDRIARALRDVRLCDRERESAVEAVMAALYTRKPFLTLRCSGSLTRGSLLLLFFIRFFLL